ncbi:hypothetical protein [Streptomyces sp. NPDC052693]|uniref:hypothetical protein n=1 Tax=Streptomyces sp. NPDC052693 TaxID=3155814 RepID=UPI0034410C73
MGEGQALGHSRRHRGCGFTGTARHPKALAVRLPDGRVALSRRLTTALVSAVCDVVVEILAGTTRHAVVTVVRLR